MKINLPLLADLEELMIRCPLNSWNLLRFCIWNHSLTEHLAVLRPTKFANQRISSRSTIFEGSKTVEFSVGSLIFFSLLSIQFVTGKVFWNRYRMHSCRMELSKTRTYRLHIHSARPVCLSVLYVCLQFMRTLPSKKMGWSKETSLERADF